MGSLVREMGVRGIAVTLTTDGESSMIKEDKVRVLDRARDCIRNGDGKPGS